MNKISKMEIKEITERELQLSRIFDATDEGIVLVDIGGDITWSWFAFTIVSNFSCQNLNEWRSCLGRDHTALAAFFHP